MLVSVVWCMFLCWGGRGGAVNSVYSIPIHKCIRWDMIFLQSICVILYSRSDGLRTRNLDSAAKCHVGMDVCVRVMWLPFKDKRLRAVAASVLMWRHSSGPMAASGMEWTSRRGILWESLTELLLQVYICCWCNFSNCWFAVWLWSWELNLSWCHQILLSPRSMNLKNFWTMAVLWARVCVHVHQTIGTNWRQSYWGNTRQQTTHTKPLVKSISFFQLQVVALSRNKRGTLFEVKWNVGAKTPNVWYYSECLQLPFLILQKSWTIIQVPFLTRLTTLTPETTSPLVDIGLWCF